MKLDDETMEALDSLPEKAREALLTELAAATLDEQVDPVQEWLEGVKKDIADGTLDNENMMVGFIKIQDACLDLELTSDVRLVLEEFFKKEFKIPKDVFRKKLKQAEIIDDLGCGTYPETYEAFVDAYWKGMAVNVNLRNMAERRHPLKSEIVQLDENDTTKERGELDESVQSFLDIVDPRRVPIRVLWRELYLYTQNKGVFANTEKPLRAAFDSKLEQNKRDEMLRLYETLRYDVTANTELNEWGMPADDAWTLFIDTLCEDKHDLSEAVLRSFVWHVKRRLTWKSVDWHMMPIIYGPQGSGKSETIRCFLKPVADAMLLADFRQLEDSTYKTMLTEYLVMFLDEMAFSTRAEQKAIKSLVTADETVFRRLYQQDIDSVRIMASFIGTSNDPLAQLFYDVTGARRYFQITTPTRIDWDIWKYFDSQNLWALLWRGVDENGDNPVLPYLDRIRKEQEKDRYQDSVEHWLEACWVELVEDESKRSCADLFDTFHDWEEKYYPNKRGNHATSLTKFSGRLKFIAETDKRIIHTNPKNVSTYQLKDEADIGQNP